MKRQMTIDAINASVKVMQSSGIDSLTIHNYVLRKLRIKVPAFKLWVQANTKTGVANRPFFIDGKDVKMILTFVQPHLGKTLGIPLTSALVSVPIMKKGKPSSERKEFPAIGVQVSFNSDIGFLYYYEDGGMRLVTKRISLYRPVFLNRHWGSGKFNLSPSNRILLFNGHSPLTSP